MWCIFIAHHPTPTHTALCDSTPNITVVDYIIRTNITDVDTDGQTSDSKTRDIQTSTISTHGHADTDRQTHSVEQ